MKVATRVTVACALLLQVSALAAQSAVRPTVTARAVRVACPAELQRVGG